MKKIKTVTIEPIKAARVRGTNEVRAIECRLTIEHEDGQKSFRFLHTLKGGIKEALREAQAICKENMVARGVL